MVIGVEIVGLVLALFQMVAPALQQCRQELQGIKHWAKYRKNFLLISGSISNQVIIFRENLETLLSPIVTSDAEMQILLEDPDGPEWKNEDLAGRVKKRLPKSHDNYFEAVANMKETLEKLVQELHIVDGKVNPRQKLWLLTFVATLGRRVGHQIQAVPDEPAFATQDGI